MEGNNSDLFLNCFYWIYIAMRYSHFFIYLLRACICLIWKTIFIVNRRNKAMILSVICLWIYLFFCFMFFFDWEIIIMKNDELYIYTSLIYLTMKNNIWHWGTVAFQVNMYVHICINMCIHCDMSWNF